MSRNNFGNGRLNFTNMIMKHAPILLLFLPLFASAAPSILELQQALNKPILEEGVPLEEVRTFIERRVPEVPDIKDPEEWKKYAAQLRKDMLEKVVFSGSLAPFWKNQKPKVIYGETLKPHKDYSIQKLRFEIMPGWWCPALLYIPANLPESKKIPVVMNFNGHDSKGKAAPYKQIRCIHQARNGMLAMNVEWIGMGQLKNRMGHYDVGLLDMCGVSGMAPFFMNMSKALDIALQHPNADADRVAVAGLSGGGWQTIFFSALDTRVKLANPVAGYSSFLTRARHPSDLGDSEQTPNDMATIADYTHLTAMMADRALLLTKNAEDKCCFAAPHALPPLKKAAEPIFKLMGRENYFRTHVNTDPGTHNFDYDNRLQLYKMLGFTFFGKDTAISHKEEHTDKEILSAEELEVPLPDDNLNMNQIATVIGKSLPVPHPKTDPFTQAIELQHAAVEIHKTLHTRGYPAVAKKGETRKFSDGSSLTQWTLLLHEEWSVPLAEIKPAGKHEKTVLLMGDKGRSGLSELILGHLNKKNRVMVLDPFYFGESTLGEKDFLYAILVAAVGERPLGIQVSQVASIATWAVAQNEGELIDIEAKGPRTTFIALTTGTLMPTHINKITLHSPLDSLNSLIRNGISANQYPEMMCFGLLKYFDISDLMKLAVSHDKERLIIHK